ncbi:MAG: NAD(P)/FAD-dependent oxidoreductase [Candidatus Gracilibacteria bacterium]
MNLSPWIHQLARTRPVKTLCESHEADVAIIGGGIAGTMTAYFTLRDTEKTVTLIDAGKIAHGATGHNAGQVVAYFERPFSELVEEFGLDMATRGIESLRHAWDLLVEIIAEAELQTPFSVCTGYAGCSSLDQLLLHLNNKKLRHKEGLDIESILIAEEFVKIEELPEEFQSLCAPVPQSHILERLETEDSSYLALLSTRKGCINSAMLCEEIIGYLLEKYSTRFQVFEEAPVQELILEKDHAVVVTKACTTTTKRAVLCTNGFEYIKILNTLGSDIDLKFHEEVSGLVGYMSGYLTDPEKIPTAISYFTTTGADAYEPYFYVTRRKYEYEKGKQHNLVCIGGPEQPLPDKSMYIRDHEFRKDAETAIDNFVVKTYKHKPAYTFKWHGLMGYTKNGVRLIGPEPCNPVLLYNLGCNGVGILSSIFGGKRISKFLNHRTLEKTIFDPQDQRCALPRK